MKKLKPEYDGREQTGIKHKILRDYLNIACRIVGPKWKKFSYVDGFSGPWNAKGDNFSDSSPDIAIKTLSHARRESIKAGRPFDVQCLFIEKDTRNYRTLEQLLAHVSGIGVKPLNGSFEDEISQVIKFVEGTFWFAFIDPKGWTGMSLKKMAPLLRSRGEVLINFMSIYIDRFITYEKISPDIDDLMGGTNWRTNFDLLLESGSTREQAAIETYCNELKRTGGFKYVKYFRVLTPDKNRTFFNLVYGTNHIRGLEKFSEVERNVYPLQAKIHLKKELAARAQKTKINDLFAEPDEVEIENQIEDDRRWALDRAKADWLEHIQISKQLPYEHALGLFLQRAFVWKSDFHGFVQELVDAKSHKIEGLTGRQKVPNKHCTLVWID
jgi:three-Cys-motif partner protein